MKEEIKAFVEHTIYIYSRHKWRNVWKNGIEKRADNHGILWLNEKHIEKVLETKMEI